MLGRQLEKLGLDNMASNISTVNFALLFLYAAVMGAAQIIFSNAANQIRDTMPTGGVLFAAFTSGWLYIGLVVYVVATVFWLYMLARVDIRFAYPVASTAVLFAALFQSLLSSSYPSLTYWIGLIIILIGLGLVNHG